MGAFFLIGASFALFFAVLISSKDNRTQPDLILTMLFLLLMLHLLGYFTYYEEIYLEYPHLLGLEDSFPLLYGPFFFFYVDTLTSEKKKFTITSTLHFLPFVIALLSYLPFYLSEGSAKFDSYFNRNSLLSPFQSDAIIVMKLLSGPVYLAWVLVLLNRHRKKITNFFSNTEEIDLSWIKFVTLVFGTFLAVVYLSLFTADTFLFDSDAIIFASMSLMVIALGYGGFRQRAIFSNLRPLDPDEPPDWVERAASESIAPGKYARSGLKEEVAKTYLEQLLDFMAEEKPYLDGDLTIVDVASILEIPRHSLTQVLNQNLGKNFYQFINEYRIEEIKKRILDPDNQQYTLLALAHDSGFNSKSTFNTVFKSYTGMTPSEFRKESEGYPTEGS